MGPIELCVAGMVLAAGFIFAYVGWQVNKKHKSMQFITVMERKRFQTLTITGITILFSALIGFGTAVMG